MSNSSLTRRTILGAGVASASALALPNIISSRGDRLARRAKNIIFCVSDGMCASVPTMVNHLSQLNTGKLSYWASLMKEPYAVNGFQDTRSLSSVVTDSSAASSSWGSGRHIWNGQVNIFPDGTELRPILDIFRSAGLRTGLVSTATITHATPAGFAVSCIDRDLEALIAEKYLAAKVNVLLGGGDKFFSAKSRKDKKDLYGEFVAAGYKVVKDRQALLGSQSDYLLGTFSSSHLPYSVDRNNDLSLQETVPTLAEMAKVAIENLNNKGKGFVLQIEGAKIDHGAHANDLAAALYDQMAFEEAVKVAVDFALKDGNTLVVITADHGTGGLSLNGDGPEYFDSTAGLLTVNGMKSSYSPMLQQIGSDPTTSRIREVIQASLGVAITESEADAVKRTIGGETVFKDVHFLRGTTSVLGAILSGYSRVAWTSGNHVSDNVILTAVGPGKENFAGLTQNIDIFDILLAQHGLKHSNPTMTLAEAKTAYDKAHEKRAELFELYADISEEDETSFGHGRLI